MAQRSIKEIIQEEYKKSAIDPVHFMRKYCVIQHPTKGKMYFNLYPFQADMLTTMQHNRYNVILKSRQLGISTLSAGFVLWNMLFKEDYNVLVIATTQEVAKNLVTKIRVMHENLPSWMKGKSIEDNKLSLRFKNGSQVKAVSSTGTAGRSEALSLLVIDEAAFIKNIDEIWASAQQTLATGGGCIALSTPNGTGNWFHKIWADAELGGQFNATKLHWTVHPERNQSWRNEQTELLGEKLAAQECDCDFITSGHTVIDGPILQWYEQTYVRQPLERRGFDSNYWIWEYPNYTKSYVVVADVARGDGADYSAFQILEIESLTQVAEYKGKIGTTEYGNMLVAIATEWNNALLVIENANIGWAVIQVAIDKNYENLYYSYKQDAYIDEDVHLSKGYDLKNKSQKIPGFSTTSKTRPLLVSKLESYFREKSPVVFSKRLIDELYVFIWNGSRPEAQPGYNDDLVMAFGIALWIRDTALRLRQQGIELSKKSLGYYGKVSHNRDNSSAITPGTAWSWKIGNNNEDLTWLI